MAKFPPANWIIKPLAEMGAFTIGAGSRELLAAALLAVEPSGEALGTFRIVLGGLKTIDFAMPLVDIIPHPSTMDLELSAQLQPGVNVHILPNSTVSAWMDLKDLVASQDMDVNDGEGESASEAFLKLLEQHQEGAALRWAVTATSNPEQPLELRLQSLPLSLARVKNTPAFMEATTATNTLLQIPLGGDYFNCKDCVGPIPLLYSNDQDATAAWNKDTAKAHAICQALYSRLVQTEVLTIKEAVAYVASPRPGLTKQPLARDYLEEPTAKRPRVDNNTNSTQDTTGTCLCEHMTRLTVETQICLNEKYKPTATKLLKAGLSNNTWARYQTGWNNFTIYTRECEINWSFPIHVSIIRGYIVWCAARSLAASTIKTYLTAISFVQALNGHNRLDPNSDAICDLLLKGVQKICPSKATCSSRRRAMSIPLLEILGHKICTSSWSSLKKKSVWAACTIAFFTAARMGELLSKTVRVGSNALQWENVLILEDRAVIKLTTRKTEVQGGVLDIFEIPKASYCPFNALIKLKHEHDVLKINGPVFLEDCKRALTMSRLNAILKEFYSPICSSSDTISCHSFRAAIPTAVMNIGIDNHEDIIKNWGGWKSNCYSTYAKLSSGQKKFYFQKILTVLLKEQ